MRSLRGKGLKTAAIIVLLLAASCGYGHWQSNLAEQKRLAFIPLFMQSAYADDDFYKSFQAQHFCGPQELDLARPWMTRNYVIDRVEPFGLFTDTYFEYSLHYSNGVTAILGIVQPEQDITSANLDIRVPPSAPKVDVETCPIVQGVSGSSD